MEEALFELLERLEGAPGARGGGNRLTPRTAR
jgi:hypothetical protein